MSFKRCEREQEAPNMVFKVTSPAAAGYVGRHFQVPPLNTVYSTILNVM